MWLRSDLGLTTVGGGVSAWADQSASGNSYSEGVGNRATFSATDANYAGRPSMTGGANLGLNLTSGAFVGGTQPITMLAVAVAASNATQQVLIGAVSQPQVGILGTNKWYVGNPNVQSSLLANTSAHAIAAVFSGAATSLYIDSSASDLVTGTNVTTNASLPVIMGVNSPPVNNWLGSVAEIAICSGTLSTANISAFFKYTARYGISAS